eukprot:TRINITY_DN22197_c0_g1_i1.p1 TRINITY_DN22197_c0_g1~~TRINITY_DN22197_c0_g1_i1.p1  ORF type:complete len:521 (+),score=38.11 TRINITY_DN22197_c0_g1_i1:16-1578(+)
MAFSDLLRQLEHECEALQARCDKALHENDNLRSRLARHETPSQLEQRTVDAILSPPPARTHISDPVHFAPCPLFRQDTASSLDSSRAASSRSGWPTSSRSGCCRGDSSGTYAPIPTEDSSDQIVQPSPFTESRVFLFFTCTFVILNALWIGFETDYMSRHWDEEFPLSFHVIDTGFCVFFTCEIVARISEQKRNFITSKAYRWWNLFDSVLVVLQVADVVGQLLLSFYFEPLEEVQCIRIVRLLRIVRLVRILSFISELRALVVSIMHAVKSLGWLLVFVFGMTYVFGVMLTQFVAFHKSTIGQDNMAGQAILDEYFGTLDRSMLMLFEAVSEGHHWGGLASPLAEYCSVWFNLLFLAYMGFMLFAVMNVITATLVESTLQIAMEEKQQYMSNDLWAVFSTTPRITREVFEHHFDHPRMKDFLRCIKLDTETANLCDLFGLIDTDASGDITNAELINGCVRMAGSARAFQLEWLTFLLRQHSASVEAKLDQLLSQVPFGLYAGKHADSRNAHVLQNGHIA